MSITLISEHQPGLIAFLKSGEISSAQRSDLHFKVMLNSSLGLDLACHWDQALVTASGSPGCWNVPKEMKVSVQELSQGTQMWQASHHTSLHECALWATWAAAGVYRWAQRPANPLPSLLQLPWFLHGGQLKSRQWYFCCVGVLGSLPWGKLWGTLSWHIELAPNTSWRGQSWQP